MDQAERQFEELLIHLKEARGFDFTGYKRSSLVRRVGRRMAALEITEYATTSTTSRCTRTSSPRCSTPS